MATSLSERDWQIRLHIYEFFVEHQRPPTTAETAGAFGIAEDEARQAYRRLHDAHTLLLEPGTSDVRMANPLSAVETPYRVNVDGRTFFANCAWDSLGIPAMLGARRDDRDGLHRCGRGGHAGTVRDRWRNPVW